MAVDSKTFDKAIDEWASTGVLPASIKDDPDSVFKLIDQIPTFVQPLTKTRFLNVADQIITSVYHRPEFHQMLIDRINTPNQPTQTTAIWLCCSLVPLIPPLATQLQQSPHVATVCYKSSVKPHVYEATSSNYRGKCLILVYANGWSEYTALLKSSKPDVARYTAAALYSETVSNPKSIVMQIKLGLVEHGYRILDKSDTYLAFVVSWISLINNEASKTLLRWDQIKHILRKSAPALASSDPVTANAAFESLCNLVGDDPWAYKKNICDKLVDLDLHRKIVPYLSIPQYQAQAVRIVDLISVTRPEELFYTGTLEHIRDILGSNNQALLPQATSISNRLHKVR